MTHKVMQARRSKPQLFVEPDVFHAIAVVDSVEHRHEPLNLGLHAGAAARVEDDRPGAVFGQPPFDFPDQLLALFAVRLGGLPAIRLAPRSRPSASPLFHRLRYVAGGAYPFS